MRKSIKLLLVLLAVLMTVCGCTSVPNPSDPSDSTKSPQETEAPGETVIKHDGYTTYINGEPAQKMTYTRNIPTEPAKEPTATEFTVARYFCKDMVIQRDNEIVIWGFAPESQNGKIVSAYFKGLSGSGVIENGKWKLSLNGTLPASTEYGNTLVVKGAGISKEFDDVLVGDVWLVSGQSNAELTFMGTTPQSSTDVNKLYKEVISAASAEDPIRIFQQSPYLFSNVKDAKTLLSTPFEDSYKSVKWTLGDKKHLRTGNPTTSCSMIAYFFAKEMVTVNPEVPIGVVNVSWGGVSLASLGSAATEKLLPSGYQNKQCTSGSVSNLPSNSPYNAFIAPILNVPVRGCLFYQGESDASAYKTYSEALKVHVEELRKDFQSDILFINLQLTSYGKKVLDIPLTTPPWTDINLLRHAQSLPEITKSITGYYSIATIDHGFKDGDGDGAHPYYKQEISARAADVAAAVIYGKTEVENVACPIPKLVEYNDNSIYLTYDHVGGGLKTNDGQAPKGFEVKIDNKWVPADAVIESESVIFIGNLAGKPTGVRYASELYYADMTYATLESGTGIPANPFGVTFSGK